MVSYGTLKGMYPKLGVGVYSTKVSEGRMICLADQGKTLVTIYYKLIVLVKKIVYENRF